MKWLTDDDVILLDRGFRDATPTMKMLGFRVAIPNFLNGRTQLTTEEANQSRFLTANRWVIEHGEHLVVLRTLTTTNIIFSISLALNE